MATPAVGRTKVATLVVAVMLAVVATALPGGAAPRNGDAEAAALEPLEVDDPAVTSGMAWHLDAIGARVAWRSSLGATVRVAVVDTGVDSTHPDLMGQVEDGVTCIGAAGDPDGCTPGGTDDSGHGTHVAGLIAARADDHRGVAGVAPRAKVLSVKALDASCTDGACTTSGDESDIAAGVRWAVENDADIVNLSISATNRLAPDLLDAISEAWDAGALVVLAAGDRSEEPTFFDTQALVVTAIDREGDLAPYAPSVQGAAVAVAAPGGRGGDTDLTCHEDGRPIGIISSVPEATGDGSGYDCLAGTSMAAAQVSGGFALLLSMGFDRDEAFDRLVSTARGGEVEDTGQGVVDLAAAVARPYPPGVNNRHDPFATGVVPPPLTELPEVGPFGVPSEPSDDAPSVWLFMLGGAVGLAVLVEIGLRLHARRNGHRSVGSG